MQQLIRLILQCLLTLLSTAAVALCRSLDTSSTAIEDAAGKAGDLILAVRKSNCDPATSVLAVPALKDAFANAPDELTKVNVASVLLGLGQKDASYLDFFSVMLLCEIVVLSRATYGYGNLPVNYITAFLTRSVTIPNTLWDYFLALAVGNPILVAHLLCSPSLLTSH